MTPTPEQWEQRFDDMWMTEEDGNSAVHTDKIRQFISQELKLQSSQLLSEVEAMRLDDRPEITEWMVKTKAETKAFNEAIDQVLSLLRSKWEKGEEK